MVKRLQRLESLGDMKAEVLICPKCQAKVIKTAEQKFRCPICGQTGEIQLNLFSSVSLKKDCDFDPLKNALAARLYHEKGRR
jgi:tRNA(Ile2) C34 agmatinyltransferase TiaS